MLCAWARFAAPAIAYKDNCSGTATCLNRLVADRILGKDVARVRFPVEARSGVPAPHFKTAVGLVTRRGA